MKRAIPQSRISRYVLALWMGAVGWAWFQATPVQAQRTLKKRVAVITFEDKTDQGYTWGQYYKDAGDGMADMLTTALVKSGKYTVMERSEIDALLEEQSLGVSGVATAESAAQIGQVLGAEILIFGTVSEFGLSSSSTSGSKRRLSVGIKSDQAVVAVDVRMVNSSTSEIVAAENVRKTDTKRGLKLGVRDKQFESMSQFDESLVGKATRKAIDSIVELINTQAPSIPWQGKVSLVNNGAVYINAGALKGVEVGDVFEVVRPGQKLIDPDTGLELGTTETVVGRIQVVDNQIGTGKAAQCKIIAGDDVQAKDIIRVPR